MPSGKSVLSEKVGCSEKNWQSEKVGQIKNTENQYTIDALG